MKGQSAMEYLIVAMFVLGFLTPIWFYLYSIQGDTASALAESYAKNTVNKLGETADGIFSQVEDARVKVIVNIPNGVISSNVSGNAIILNLYTSYGQTSVIAYTKATVNGTLPSYPGRYTILIEARGDYVQIEPVLQ